MTSDLTIGSGREVPSALRRRLAATVRKGPRAAATAPRRHWRRAVMDADVLPPLCSSPRAPLRQLDRPVSALLPKDGAGEVRRVDPRSRCRGTTRGAQGGPRWRQPPWCGRKHARDRDIGNVVHDSKIQLPAGTNRPLTRRLGAQLLKKAQANPCKNSVVVPPAARVTLKPVNKKQSNGGDGCRET
ncbi:hypothetical protein ZWY2020_008026 [Hordeum vulgare]|nr:hypothetical protein ZWY2020_008026 [Hordeum vulgare]